MSTCHVRRPARRVCTCPCRCRRPTRRVSREHFGRRRIRYTAYEGLHCCNNVQNSVQRLVGGRRAQRGDGELNPAGHGRWSEERGEGTRQLRSSRATRVALSEIAQGVQQKGIVSSSGSTRREIRMSISHRQPRRRPRPSQKPTALRTSTACELRVHELKSTRIRRDALTSLHSVVWPFDHQRRGKWRDFKVVCDQDSNKFLSTVRDRRRREELQGE